MGHILDGVDVVAYHSMPPGSSSQRGKASHVSEYKGYTFQFVDGANKELFDEKPEFYLPVW